MTSTAQFVLFLVQKHCRSWGWMVLLLGVVQGGFAQTNNLGLPSIDNFSKQDYNAATQNWDVVQNSRGLLYFANNSGVLEFDGQHWRTLPLPNQTQVRSLAMGPSDRLYVGGQGEVGYFEPNEHGALMYRSLVEKVPEEHRVFDEVWSNVTLGPLHLFFASGKVFVSRGEQYMVESQLTDVAFMGLAGEQVVVQDRQKGLAFINPGGTQLLDMGQMAQIGTVAEVIPLENESFLLITFSNGIYHYNGETLTPWETEYDAFFKENSVLCGAKMPDGAIALGTARGGLVVLDQNKKAWYKLTKTEGLQNNTLLSLMPDRTGNLWLGLDNGIDHVELNTPFRKLFPDNELQGTGYAAKVFGDNIFFGTNHGLYFRPWKPYYDPFDDVSFALVEGTLGQVWGINEVNGMLLMGHHEGAFSIENNQAKPIPGPAGGAWLFRPVMDADQLLVGLYNGLGLTQRQGNGWAPIAVLPGLEGSCRFIEQVESDVVWIAHPNRGIFKVDYDPNNSSPPTVQHFNQDNGFPSAYFAHCFSINNEVVFTGEAGVFNFDPATNGFPAATAYESILGDQTRVRRLKEGVDGDVWFATDQGIGWLEVEDKALAKEVNVHTLPVPAADLVDGFEFIYPLDAENVFIGMESGFLHFNPERWSTGNTLPTPLLRSLEMLGDSDSLLFGGAALPTDEPVSVDVPYDWNHLRMAFSLPHYSTLGQTEFQYCLKGFNDKWSTWSTVSEREFTNLPSGSYTFMLRARRPGTAVVETTLYTVNVLPPWFASNWAIGMYILLFALIVLGIVFVPRLRLQQAKEQFRLENEQNLQQKDQEHQKAVQRSEKAIFELKNEKLQSEVKFKNKELASTTMHLVQKSEILLQLKRDLAQLGEEVKEEGTQKTIRQLVRRIDSDIQLDRNWKQFEHNFDQVHVDFIKRIKKQYPQLTPKDIKLCAYLRMNLSTKEMAPLLNISVRGVEISRYRLRKKLDLEGDTNLVEFITSV